MVSEACLPSNAYYPRTPDYTIYSGVHVCWSEHSDSPFVYGFMSLDYGLGTMTTTIQILSICICVPQTYVSACQKLSEYSKRFKKKVREKSGECHNHKPQPFPDPKRKRKPTNPNKHKSNKRTKSTKISSLFPKRGNRNTKRTEKHKNKMTHSKTYNKSPRRINHKAKKSKTNTGTTALERSEE